ncbi:MAG TPA: c-type cytochrome [Polyangia bacterium]|nr:c-type cytochrome [Polyangia bacterium]
MIAAVALASCKQEYHDVHPAPARPAIESVAGGRPAPANPYADNGYGMSEGNRLYQAFNCTGCHAHGGGGIGPALMDRRWLYGGAPEAIFQSIAAGRPQGMPAFGQKLMPDQIWQLVAYVRSMSGLAPTAEAPGRTDDLNLRPGENRLDPLQPLPPEKGEGKTGGAL